MAWRLATDKDLLAHLSQVEVDAFRKSVGDETVVMNAAAAEVRSACRANKGVRLHPSDYYVPEGLLGTMMDIVAFRILKRMPVEKAVSKQREMAYTDAVKRLEEVARGTFMPESYESTDEKNDRNIPLYGLSFRPNILR